MSTYRGVNARLAYCLNSALDVKAVVAAFNQEKALVGAFSVITNLRMELFQALALRRDGGGGHRLASPLVCSRIFTRTLFRLCFVLPQLALRSLMITLLPSNTLFTPAARSLENQTFT